MPRAKANKLYNTFVKGLITEASPLTYPEDASYSESNCVLYRKGNRSRRLGMDFETGYTLSTATSTSSVAINEGAWHAVANTNLHLLCQQVGSLVYFYDLASTPLNVGLQSFTIDLNAYLAPSQTDTSDTIVTFAHGKGYLFIAGSKIEPLYVEYDPLTSTITVRTIKILIRDMAGVDDGLSNDQEPLTLSKEHDYNLRNQGWVDPNMGSTSTATVYNMFYGTSFSGVTASSNVINQYYTKFSRYPGNNKQWWIAKAAVDNSSTSVKQGDFLPELLNKVFMGNNRAPRGHYIVDAFNIDRSSVSGIYGLPSEVISERPSSVAFFAGRAWYVCNSFIYYTQILDSKGKMGFCYQEADPTSEILSDLIATDGGVIPIPEMTKGMKVIATGSSLMSFAQDGVWAIYGSDTTGFKATDFVVSKISPIGTESPLSIVEAGDNIFWWSNVGIQGISQTKGMFGAVSGKFDNTTITEKTIATYYFDTIPTSCKPYVKGVYDAALNTVVWLYRLDETLPTYFYDSVLNLDLSLSAFYPWTVSKKASNSPYITGVFITPHINQISTSQAITDSGVAITDSGVPITTSAFSLAIRSSFVKYSVFQQVSSTTYKWAYGYFSNTSFADWGTEPYTSFIETGYELLQDAMREKMLTYVVAYFKRTETEYVFNGTDYTLSRPSSCKFFVKWDWTDAQGTGKWAREVEAYRTTRLYNFSTSNLLYDNGYPVVVTKHKVRGNGKAIQFRFSGSEIGKDFNLLGWSAAYTGATEV